MYHKNPIYSDTYRKFLKYSDTQKNCCNHSKIWTMWLYHRVMSPNDADGMANSVDPDQTAPLGAVWSGSALFAQACLSENLGSLRYIWTLPDLQGGSLKWALKFLLKHTTFCQNFKISLIWIKNFAKISKSPSSELRIFLYILYIFLNPFEMKEKSPWCPFETYHIYADSRKICCNHPKILTRWLGLSRWNSFLIFICLHCSLCCAVWQPYNISPYINHSGVYILFFVLWDQREYSGKSEIKWLVLTHILDRFLIIGTPFFFFFFFFF